MVSKTSKLQSNVKKLCVLTVIMWLGGPHNHILKFLKLHACPKSTSLDSHCIGWRKNPIWIKQWFTNTTSLSKIALVMCTVNVFTASYPNIFRVVYCVVTEANLSIMSCRHDTYPSRHYAGWCLYPDGLEFYRILCVITLPHFGHVGFTMSTCDDMSAK